MGKMTVAQWKEVFQDAGLSDEAMDNWHACFEKKYPEGHQDFLQWLGLNQAHIDKIRQESK